MNIEISHSDSSAEIEAPLIQSEKMIIQTHALSKLFGAFNKRAIAVRRRRKCDSARKHQMPPGADLRQATNGITYIRAKRAIGLR